MRFLDSAGLSRRRCKRAARIAQRAGLRRLKPLVLEADAAEAIAQRAGGCVD